MKTRIYLLLITSLFLAVNAYAAEFTVMAKQGDASVQRNSRGKYEKIRTGESINKNDRIKLKKGAYLGLLHKASNKTLEIKKRGTYNISSLIKEVNKKKQGINQRFAGYVMDEITGSEDIFATGASENMKTLGSVDRAVGGDETEKHLSSATGVDENISAAAASIADQFSEENSLHVILPRSSYFVDNEVEFSWHERDETVTYEFRIVDTEDNEIYSKRLHNNKLAVDFDEAGLQKGQTYYWYLQDGDIQSNQYAIYRMADSEAGNVIETANSIGDSPSALDMIMLAHYYEDLNIQNRAVEAYEKAIEMEPEVGEYKKAYAKYLARAGLFNEARAMMAHIKQDEEMN